jgi:hypothetical protein
MSQTTYPAIANVPAAVTKFERWLKARGYEPVPDPFAPEADGRVEASALVLEYLIDRPEDAAGQALLLRHAYEIGGVPNWDEGTGYALGS